MSYTLEPPSCYAVDRIVSRDCFYRDEDVPGSTECDWSGDVDAVIEDDTLYWTCPKCLHEHEEYAERYPEPDPDSFRD